MRVQITRYISIIFLAMIGGCGGGGGVGSTAVTSGPVAQISFPIEATFTTLATSGSSYNVSASDSQGNVYTLAFTITPGPTKTFFNVPRLTYMESATLKKNGILVNTTSSEVYFSGSPFTVWGAWSGTNDVLKVTQQGVLPATATVGASGPFFSGTKAIGNFTLNTVSETATWSLEADTSSTAWLCINTSTAAGLTTSAGVASECFRVNGSGSVVGFKTDVTVSGVTLSFR